MFKIEKEKKIYHMSSKNAPVLKVEPGNLIEFETYDCFQNQIISNEQGMDALNWEQINPATGPVYIKGAEVGDILEVKIKKIAISDQGVMVAIPNAGLLGEEVVESEVKVLPIKDGVVHFNENITIPVEPMIGVIGVAPSDGEISCGTPGCHGGNMDNKKITENTTLYFPVFVEGALLALGDLHGGMGDGEIMVSGVEVAGKVLVEVDVIKNKKINHPILENDSHYYVIASHKDLLVAVKIATKEMQKIIMSELDLSFNEAGMLLSAIGNIEICQVVDPLLTVRFGVSKEILKSVF